MKIEADARRFICKAINIEKELTSIEIREKLKGRIVLNNEHYHNLRKKLVKILNQINSVANVEGKGRDDLAFEILLEAEGIIRRISKEQSKAVRNLAEQIRNVFIKLRNLFEKYEKNIEMVDPQLKNNIDLVESLSEFERTWEKGNTYFLDSKKLNHLIFFSHIIEATSEKYKEFEEQLECRECDIFVKIPSLMLLKNLDNDDKNICLYFLPRLFNEKEEMNKTYIKLQKEFQNWKKSHMKNYEYFNVIEKKIIGINLNEKEKAFDKEEVNNIVHKIKLLAIELERNNPLEWNAFLEAALEYF